jgi:hypothetical protein
VLAIVGGGVGVSWCDVLVWERWFSKVVGKGSVC